MQSLILVAVRQHVLLEYKKSFINVHVLTYLAYTVLIIIAQLLIKHDNNVKITLINTVINRKPKVHILEKMLDI